MGSLEYLFSLPRKNGIEALKRPGIHSPPPAAPSTKGFKSTGYLNDPRIYTRTNHMCFDRFRNGESCWKLDGCSEENFKYSNDNREIIALLYSSIDQ